MSLLNQMLKDLDQRRAEGSTAPSLHREIRPLPPAPSGPLLRPWIAGLCLSTLAGAGAWWWFAAPATPLPAAVSGATLPELAVPAPIPAPALASSVAAPVQLVPAELAAGNHPRLGDNRLRLSDQLSPLAVESPPPAAAAAPAAPAVAPPSAAAIDKTAREPNQREQAERLYRSAVTLLNQGREQDGVNTLRAALRDDPEQLAARQLLIKLKIDRSQFEAAQAELEEGLRRLPRQTPWAMLLSRLLVERGDPAGGLAVLERHEAHAGGAADYQGAMAAILQRLGRQAEAEARFVRASQAEPANGRWWLGLGLAREAQGKTAEALAAFRNAQAATGLSPELRAFAEAKAR